MPRATNNDVLAAIAKLMECRDHRRGRKPSWNILIHTDDNGTVHIKDLITNCSQIVGKRAYKKRVMVETAPGSNKYKKHTITIPTTEDRSVANGGARISPITGKPVRKYKPRAHKFTVVANEPKPDTIKIPTYKDKLMIELAELKVGLTQTKLSRDATNDEKKIKVFDRAIDGLNKKIEEVNKIIAAQR